MVEATFADLQSQFLVMPRGSGFIPYPDFQDAYEILKRHTNSFTHLTESSVWAALRADSLVFVVLRTILGMTPPELAELARTDGSVIVPQSVARTVDARCRSDRGYLDRLAAGQE
jgi:hypothetical protein